MSLGIPLNLCFCLLICLVYGSLVDEKPGKETLVPHNEDEVHRHLMKRMTHCNDSVPKNNTCPPEWHPFLRSCYRYDKRPMSFDEAETECQSYGGNGHLVSIHDCEVSQFVASIVPKEENGNVWIGCFKGHKNGEEWKWTDGSPMDYWVGPGPTNGQDNDMGVQLSKSSKFIIWAVESSNSASGFICENDF